MTREEIVYCKDCKHSRWSRSGKIAEEYGKDMSCAIEVIPCPRDFDFCSYGKKILRCPKCGRRYEIFPNYCSNCGEKLKESEDEQGLSYADQDTLMSAT